MLIAITPGLGRDLAAEVAAAHAGGVDAVLLREPVLWTELGAPGILLHGRTPGAVQAAIASGCGLHLPSSMDAAPLRDRIRGTLSQSCHDAAALQRAAAAGCDFAFLSPVFAPHSKPGDVRPILGLAGLAALCGAAPLPVIALGGIGPAQAGDCLLAGAAGIACIGAIFSAGDVTAAARRMRRACGPTAFVG